MRRTNRIVPTYTGDVSGACSALFELGGMVVIHDPSGCNSTYNTHDETRWYDHDSLIFITGLVERDAIMGNDSKLVADVVEAARELQPRFIALCNSPIPFLNGTDFRAVCKLVERACGIPCFYVRTNGMHDYVAGASAALVALAERFVERDVAPRPGKANIIGVTPLDLGVAGSDESLRAFVRAAGFDVVSCWAMGSTLDEVARAGEASVNLVVSALGLPVAKWLRERFGTPYVAGFPLGGTPEEPLRGAWNAKLAAALHEAEKTGSCLWPARDRGALPAGDEGACEVREDSTCAEPTREACEGAADFDLVSEASEASASDGRQWALVGEPVFMGSLAAALAAQGVGRAKVICPLEADPELLGPGDVLVEGEEGVQEALASATDAIADVLYAPIVPPGCRLHELPHQAFSGRNSWRDAQDPAFMDISEILLFGYGQNR